MLWSRWLKIDSFRFDISFVFYNVFDCTNHAVQAIPMKRRKEMKRGIRFKFVLIYRRKDFIVRSSKWTIEITEK